MADELPCIGIWTLTRTSAPTAGNTLIGLWQCPRQRIEFFCAFYVNADGEAVDPDEEEWDRIAYHSRQGDCEDLWGEEIDPPDYWAECRFLIPAWGGE